MTSSLLSSIANDSQVFVVDMWLKVWEGNLTGRGIVIPLGEIVRIDKVIRLRVGMMSMQIMIGEDGIWREITTTTGVVRLMFREWTLIAVRIDAKTISIYR
jgi:hypothetical protein